MMTTNSLWIGLFRDSWNWWDGSSSSFRYWSSGQPSGLSASCVAADFRNSGKWANHDCSLRKPFICYDPRQNETSQYYFVYDLKTMTEARDYCRKRNAELATIHDMQDVTTLNNMADLSQMLSSSGQAWIGLYGETDSWRWSLSNTSVYEDVGMEFRPWYPGYPRNHHCILISTNGQWYDNSCESLYHAACMDVRGTNATFVITPNRMTWTEAQSYCRKHHTDLASLRNQAENAQVKNMMTTESLWIGLFRDSWNWWDGSSSSFRYWSSGKPTGLSAGCVAADFRNSGKWANHDCSLRKPFICYDPRQNETSQYYFVYDLKTMTEARDYCRKRNAELATIHDMEDVTRLNNMADLSLMLSSSGQAWIGLYGETDSWRWSLSNTSVYEDVGTVFRPWYPGYPRNHHCILINTNGQWYDNSCESLYHAACMDVRGTNVTFVITPNPMTWTEAQSYCREHHTDLASLRNQAENEQVKNMMTTDSLWIGLFRDSWNWWDGSSSSFRYWSSGKPTSLSAGCVAADFRNSGKWANHYCSLRKPFICYDPRQNETSQYYFVYDLKTMTEARDYCRKRNAELATIHDMEDVTRLNNMADLSLMASSSGQAWIGLYGETDSWRWSLSNTSGYEDVGTVFRPWYPGYPRNHHCILIYTNGQWYDNSCESLYHAACMDVRGTNATFVITPNRMTWTEAQSYCREHHTDLASLRNQAENEQVKNMMTTDSLWIGLFRDSWNWWDGSSSSFRYWSSGKPTSLSAGCVAADFRNSGKWANHYCNLRKPFICYDPRQNETSQYYFVYDLKTMTEARDYCRKRNAELATIHDMEDVTRLNNMADLSLMLSSSAQAWIGLYGETDSWRWSLSNTSVYEDVGTVFRPWYPGYPGNHHCILIYTNGQWYDNSCESLYHAACMDVRGTNVTFVITPNPMTWTEAQSYCREHHTDLASLRNQAENEQVKNMMTTDSLWIGLFRDSWNWWDGSSSSFRYWSSGKPTSLSAGCVAADFRNSGKWANHYCHLRKPFICYDPGQNETSQYYFVYDLKTMTEARDYCRKRNAELATIHNMEDVTRLNNMADLSLMLSSSAQAWIGLYGETGSWRWSLSNTSGYEDVGTVFRPWYPGYPGNHHCILINTNGQWYDNSCESLYQAACMDVRGTNVTFVITPNPMTWTEAQSYCRKHHTDLASVRNQAENEQVKNMM
ncbi:macrophage mannose receptor 1-like, partial [Centropristis striata]|uniref:macrophage mannose receptor 1-like n=1 Tax=Centropristis striata TaxID=184440 RepID=UPI0027E17C65